MLASNPDTVCELDLDSEQITSYLRHAPIYAPIHADLPNNFGHLARIICNPTGVSIKSTSSVNPEHQPSTGDSLCRILAPFDPSYPHDLAIGRRRLISDEYFTNTYELACDALGINLYPMH